jgi:hypothetical protein
MVYDLDVIDHENMLHTEGVVDNGVEGLLGRGNHSGYEA